MHRRGPDAQSRRSRPKLQAAAGSAGPGGIFTLALSAHRHRLLGPARARPKASRCARLLGGLRDRVPTYASGALMRQHPVDYLAKAGPRLVGMGFRQMKMQCGSEPTVAASVERVRVMRESIGPDIDLMCDINQLWSVHHAIEVGKRIEQYHLFWLEDPTAHDDYRRPGARRRRAGDADRRRRVPLRHRAVPPPAGGALDRHRDDRPAARGRHHPVDEGGRHGRGLQPARW